MMGYSCTLICGGVCRLYIGESKKWINTNIEGGLIVCIDKDQNHAPLLRIFDLNTLKIRFEMEMFKSFDKYLQFANSQFMLINVPMVADHYFGVSFGHVEDAKLVHTVVTLLSGIENLPQTFSLPNIQHSLVRRNLALQSKDNYEKSTKQPSKALNEDDYITQAQRLLNAPSSSQQQSQFPVINQQQPSFWGKESKAQNQEDGGRVSDSIQRLLNNQSDHWPNNPPRRDTFNASSDQLLMNDQNSYSLNGSHSKEEQKNKILNPKSFVRSSQSSIFNQNPNIFGYQSKQDQPMTNQMSKTQYVSPNVAQVHDMNRSLILNKPLISSIGYDENSKIYDITKIDPNLRDIMHKAGIKPKELSDAAFAPLIKSIINQAEQRKVEDQSRVDVNLNQQKLLSSSNMNMMPQGSISEKKSSFNDQIPNKANQIAQNDIQSQQQKGDTRTQNDTKQQDFRLSQNDRQELTNLLAFAIEERRQQIQKNVFESEERSSWEND